jgi:hypothetical protein
VLSFVDLLRGLFRFRDQNCPLFGHEFGDAGHISAGQNSAAEEVQVRPAVHLPLQHLDPLHLAFDSAGSGVTVSLTAARCGASIAASGCRLWLRVPGTSPILPR